MIGRLEIARLLRGLFSKADDRLDHRLEVPVAEHHRAKHDVFAQFLGLGFNHQNGVLRARDHQIELAFGHFIDLRVEHVFVVDEADAGSADRTHERDARQRQRGGSRNHRQNVGIVFEIVRQRGDDHLRIAAIAVGEQRTDRTVDQTRDQRFLFGRTAFALEVAAGNTARGVSLFLVVTGEREKIDASLRLLGRNDRRNDDCFSVGCDNGPVGLTCNLSCLKDELAPTPIQLLAMNIEHVCFLSWFRNATNAMSKTARRCIVRNEFATHQRPAILPWLSRLSASDRRSAR